MKPQGPCKDCEDRSTACWGVCEKYKAYREELKEYHRKLYSGRAANAYGGRPWMKKNSRARKEYEKEAERDRKK